MSGLRQVQMLVVAMAVLLSSLTAGPLYAAQGRKFVLVIGIGAGYQSPAFKTLQFPELDAQRVAERFQKLGFTVVARVIGEKATKSGIQQAINDLGQVADNPNDTVVIYYSGHGALVKGADGVSRPSLVPQDATPANKLSYVTDTELGNWLNASLGTRKVALILDSCYSAGIGGLAEKRLTDPEQIGSQQVVARLQALQQAQYTAAFFNSYLILASSQAQETSKEKADKGGLFTYYLLQGLGDETTANCPACDAGQAYLSLNALLRYTADGLSTQVDQRPELKGDPGQARVWTLSIPWVNGAPEPVAMNPTEAQPVASAAPSAAPTAAPVPTPDPDAGKPRLAILPFSTPKMMPALEQFGLETMDYLFLTLKNQHHFAMVDRARTLETIQQQHLTPTGLNEISAMAIGKLLGAQLAILGRFRTEDNGNYYILEVEIADLANDQIISRDRREGNKDHFGQIQEEIVRAMVEFLSRYRP